LQITPLFLCDDFTNSSPTQDAVLVAEEKAIINALKEASFNIRRDSRFFSTPSHS